MAQNSYGDVTKIYSASPEAPGIVGGVAIAPIGTIVPNTSFISLTDEMFKQQFRDLGFITTDGIKTTPKIDNDNVVAWGGKTIAVIRKSFNMSFKFQLMQTLSEIPNAAAFGVKNVSMKTSATGSEKETIVKINNYVNEHFVWVIDSFYNGVHVRDVFPNACVTEIGEIDSRTDQVTHYDLTVSAFPDNVGNYGYSYKGTYNGDVVDVLSPDLSKVTFANGLNDLGTPAYPGAPVTPPASIANTGSFSYTD